MTTKLSDLRVGHVIGPVTDDMLAAASRPASTADLVAALIAEGGEIVNRYDVHPDGEEYWRGKELRFPIPAEEKTTT